MKENERGNPLWTRIGRMRRKAVRWLRHGLGLPVDVHGVRIRTRTVGSRKILGFIIHGAYEREEATALNALLRPGDRVLELGSGLGVISCLAGKVASRVLAFEANPRLVEIAEDHLALNGVDNVEIRAGVLAGEAGQATFYVGADFWESSLTPFAGAVQIETAVHALGPVLAEFAPTVLVMDIEGGEYALLNLPEWTACRSLRAIVVEIHRPPTEDALRGLACLQAPWKLDRTVDQLAAEIRSGGNRTVTLLRD